MNSVLSLVNIKRAAIAAMLIAAILYVFTMNRTYGFIDQGELAAVASTLGVAHPTGYPLLMLFGFLWTQIMPFESILALNILSLLLCSCSVYFLTLLIDYVLIVFANDNYITSPKHIKSSNKKKEKNKTKVANKEAKQFEITHYLTNEARAYIAAITALIIGTSSLWWSQSNGFEVYSLHLFFMPLLTLLFLKYLYEPDLANENILIENQAEQNYSEKITLKNKSRHKVVFSFNGNIFSLCLGLSFSNHLLTVLFAPAFLFLFFYKNGFNLTALKKILYLVPGFLVGLLPYIILPITAANKPFLNWGDVSNLENFIRHVTAFQYRVWMFQSAEAFRQNSTAFLRIVPTELAIIGLLLTLWGLSYWFKKNKIIFTFIIILFLTNFIYSGGYDITDILNYYTGSLFAFSFLLAGGLAALHDKLNSNIFTFLAPLLIVINIIFNFSKVNENGNSLVKDYTHNVLNSLPKKSIIISAQWDFFVAASMYEQATNKLRRDVVVIDPELMRRSWYIKQLDYNHPFLMKNLQSEKNNFLEQLALFENNLQYSPQEIQEKYVGLLDGIIDKNKNEFNIFFSGISDQDFGKKYARIPYHLGYIISETQEKYIPQKFIDYEYNQFINPETGIKSWFRAKQNPYTAKINEFYTRYIYERMNYELHNGKTEEAKKYRKLVDKFLIDISDEEVENVPPKNRDLYKETKKFFEEIKNILPKIDV